MANGEDPEERRKRRMQTWQFEAVDASGKVIAKSAGTTQLHTLATTMEQSLFYLKALHDLRCQFYPEVDEGKCMDRSIVTIGFRS